MHEISASTEMGVSQIVIAEGVSDFSPQTKIFAHHAKFRFVEKRTNSKINRSRMITVIIYKFLGHGLSASNQFREGVTDAVNRYFDACRKSKPHSEEKDKKIAELRTENEGFMLTLFLRDSLDFLTSRNVRRHHRRQNIVFTIYHSQTPSHPPYSL